MEHTNVLTLFRGVLHVWYYSVYINTRFNVVVNVLSLKHGAVTVPETPMCSSTFKLYSVGRFEVAARQHIALPRACCRGCVSTANSTLSATLKNA